MSLAGRQLRRELLDDLPASAPEAVHSRGDLRRLNALMGNVDCLAKTAEELKVVPPKVLVELACGDGGIMVKLLDRMGWKPERIVLLDQQPVLAAETLRKLQGRATEVEVIAADVFEWLGGETASRADLVVTNLFLHHFADERLRGILSLVPSKAEAFIACEPRRSAFALLNSQLVGLIGCNRVTRHDAPVSVRAGFLGDELTRLWPKSAEWRVTERQRGLFSHCFGARRITIPSGA